MLSSYEVWLGEKSKGKYYTFQWPHFNCTQVTPLHMKRNRMREMPFLREKTIRCSLLRGFIIQLFLLGSFGHLVAVPAWTVGVRLLHLRVELPTAGEVIDRLKREGGLISREVQRQVHYRKTREQLKYRSSRTDTRYMTYDTTMIQR